MKQSSIQFLFFILSISFRGGDAVGHQLYVQKSTTFPPPKYTSDATTPTEDSFRHVDTTFSPATVTNVCAFGMWALYNVSSFGEGSETTTSTMVIRGFDARACATTTAYPALRLVQSIHWLGNDQRDVAGLVIYSEPNFLGSRFYPATPMADKITPLVAPIDSIRLGSFAITGETGRWRLCADKLCESTVICIDMTKYRGGFYFNRNVVGDKSATWPAYVRAFVYNPTAEVCAGDGSPPLVTAASVAARNGLSGGKPVLEVYT